MPPETSEIEEARPVNAIEEISKMLAAEEPNESEAQPEPEVEEPEAEMPDGDETEEPESSEEEEPQDVKLTDIAKKLGVDPEDLYSAKVAIDGREPMSIGELKDAVQGTYEALESEREQFRNSKMQQERELSQVLSMLPEVPPELVQYVQTRQAEHIEKEYNALINVLPEWKDTAVYQADRTAMIEHLKAYGFGPGELDSISDHRLMKYVRDNMARERRAKAVMTPQPKAPSKPVKSGGTKKQAEEAARARLFKAAQTGGTQEKVAAITELLK